MSSAQVQDYALMRPAQLTLENGGDWFEVITADTDADAKRRYSTKTDYQTQYVVQQSCGLLGCINRLVPVLTRTEHDVFETQTIFEHAIEIRVGKGAKPAGAPNAYDAQDTFGTLRAPRLILSAGRQAFLGQRYRQFMRPGSCRPETLIQLKVIWKHFLVRSRGFVPHPCPGSFAAGRRIG